MNNKMVKPNNFNKMLQRRTRERDRVMRDKNMLHILSQYFSGILGAPGRTFLTGTLDDSFFLKGVG